jgi:hypothetical protein
MDLLIGSFLSAILMFFMRSAGKVFLQVAGGVGMAGLL